MSYLLDALRKSEAQRRLGQVPGLEIAPAAPHQARRSRKVMLFAMGLLIVAISAFLLWREVLAPRGAPAVAEIAGEPGAAEESAPDLEPPPEPADEVAIAETPAPTPAEREAQLREEARRRREAVMQARQERVQPEAAPAVPGETQAAETVPTEPVTTEPAVADADARPATPQPETAAPEAPARATTPPGRREYMQQWELPAAVRSELPPLQLMAHIYSDDPEGRFVLINGRRYGEGDELGQDVVLAEIRREGAIIDFREYRFILD